MAQDYVSRRLYLKNDANAPNQRFRIITVSFAVALGSLKLWFSALLLERSLLRLAVNGAAIHTYVKSPI